MNKDKIQKVIDTNQAAYDKYQSDLSAAQDKIRILEVENVGLKNQMLGFDLEDDYKTRIQQLEAFIANELGLEAKSVVSNCASPVSYCNDCGCGKKQRIEGKK